MCCWQIFLYFLQSSSSSSSSSSSFRPLLVVAAASLFRRVPLSLFAPVLLHLVCVGIKVTGVCSSLDSHWRIPFTRKERTACYSRRKWTPLPLPPPLLPFEVCNTTRGLIKISFSARFNVIRPTGPQVAITDPASLGWGGGGEPQF